MTTPPRTLTVYFDFLCPFAYRTSFWVDMLAEQLGAALQVEWNYFSLEQHNTPAERNWNIWEQTDDYESPASYDAKWDMRGLLAFWGAEAARQQGAEAFNRFRRTLYAARHRDKLAFTRPAVTDVAARSELDMARFEADFANRSLLDVLRQHHTEARDTYAVFGVPTILFDGQNPLFLKTMSIPPAEEVVPLFEELQQSFLNPRREWLAEVKRADPGKLR